jgi:hypothetical protein
LVLGASVLLVGGCGGEDSPAATGGSGGQAWTVSGSPPASVVAGRAFSFTPTVSNGGSASLVFSYSNLPAWLSVNASNGTISGTPGSSAVGTYSNIRLTVTDGTNTYASPAYSIQVVGTATGSAMLTWQPPTTYTDGSSLQIAGYRVYWGTSQNNLNNSVNLQGGGLSSYVVDQLTPGTWYFAVSALDAAQLESSMSNVASKTI